MAKQWVFKDWFFKLVACLVSDVRSAVVATLVTTAFVWVSVYWAFALGNIEEPAWFRTWQQVQPVPGYLDSDAEHWCWAPIQIKPVEPGRLQIIGLPGGKTELGYPIPSNGQGQVQNDPVCGDVYCSDHGRRIKKFRMWFNDNNFLELQMFDVSNHYLHSIWFRAFELDATDSNNQSLRAFLQRN